MRKVGGDWVVAIIQYCVCVWFFCCCDTSADAISLFVFIASTSFCFCLCEFGGMNCVDSSGKFVLCLICCTAAQNIHELANALSFSEQT